MVEGVVYVGGLDGALYAVDAGSGEERWRFQTDGDVISSPGGGYVGSGDRYLYAIGAGGGG